MSVALSELRTQVDALETHAAAVNAERVNLYVQLQAAQAVPPAPPPVDETEIAALVARVAAVSASIVAPVASLVPAPVEPAPSV